MQNPVALGYNVHDLARFMLDLDYEVYVSEWHPIIRCGPSYDWRRIVRYTADPELSDVWGNLVGFHPGRSLR
jgi:hypothetical protein